MVRYFILDINKTVVPSGIVQKNHKVYDVTTHWWRHETESKKTKIRFQNPKNNVACPRSHSIRSISNAKIKTVKLTIVVVVGYLVCSAPFVCVQVCFSTNFIGDRSKKTRPFFKIYERNGQVF